MIYAQMTPADKLEAGEIYKYVRLSTGEIRFARFSGFGPDHAQMLDYDKAESAISAGAVLASDDWWEFLGYGSTTCNVRWLQEDTELLTAAIKKKIKE